MPKFGKINLNRRVVDHRVFVDRGQITNGNIFTKNYFWAIRQRFYNTFINGYPVYGGACMIGLASAFYVFYMFKANYKTDAGRHSIINQDFRQTQWAGKYLNDQIDTPAWDRVNNSYEKN